MWMNFPMVFVLTVVGTKCQKVTLDTLPPISPCTSGLRSGLDKFVINGTVAGNVTDYLTSGWGDIIYIEVVTKTSEKKPLCPINVTQASCSNPNLALQCYCNDVNPTTGEVHFVVNYTAAVVYSQEIIRAQWQNNNSTLIYSNNQTLPTIHDVQAAQLNLSVSGASENPLTLEACSYSLTLNNLSSLTSCCYNTATPCYPQISFNGDAATNKSCVSYPPSRLPSAWVTGHLILSLSLCNQVDYVQRNSCTVTIQKKSTPGPNIPLIVSLSVILPIVAIPVSVASLWYCKNKSKKPKISTNQSAPTAEPHNKDG